MNKIANYDWTHLDQNPNEYTKGGTRKIADAPPRPCQNPEHNPPGMMVFSPGIYEHTCPGCGNKQVFIVNGMYM